MDNSQVFLLFVIGLPILIFWALAEYHHYKDRRKK